MREIIYCRECDHRYENLDGTMECMWFECITVKPDDFCAWGERGEGTKEEPRKPWTEEEQEEFFRKHPRMIASSATILTEEEIERMKEALAALPIISMTVNQKGE